MDRQAGNHYPDRDAWPGYWRAIRTAAVWLAVGVVIVGGGAMLPRPDDLLTRVIVEVGIALLAAAVASFLAGRVNAWWDDRNR